MCTLSSSAKGDTKTAITQEHVECFFSSALWRRNVYTYSTVPVALIAGGGRANYFYVKPVSNIVQLQCKNIVIFNFLQPQEMCIMQSEATFIDCFIPFLYSLSAFFTLFVLQRHLSKADTLGTNIFVRFRQMSALDRLFL